MHPDDEDHWDGLSFDSKIRIISPWALVLLLANIITMADCFRSLGVSSNQLDHMTIGRSLGLSSFLYWISLWRYLTYDSKLAAAPNTMIGAAKNSF